MGWRGPQPRWGTPRRAERPSHGSLAVSVARLMGWDLYGWQRDAADISTEYNPRTRLPHYRTVGLSVARQNGKTTLVLVRVALQLIVPKSLVAYTAQDRNMARLKWLQYVEALMATPFRDRVKHVSRVNGSEALIMHNGSQFLIVTPGEGAGRSLSLDLAIIDEAAQHRDMTVVGALGPTTMTRPFAQVWLLSNAGTFDSAMWRHYTESGRAQVDNPLATLCWLEWAADDDVDVFDRVGWAEANPSMDLPGGVTSVALMDAAMTLPADTFRRENLNLWVGVSASGGIDQVAWAACRDDDAVPGDALALGLDFTPERDRGALVAAGDRDGRTPLDVIEAGSDLDRLVTRAGEVAARWEANIVIDRGGPAASAVPALERATAWGAGNHRVRLIGLPDLARACGDFYDAATHARLSHRGDFRLGDAVSAAAKRRVGDGWVWRRRGNAADITPVIAATLARWGVITAPAEPTGELRIY